MEVEFYGHPLIEKLMILIQQGFSRKTILLKKEI
ncbi:MAG: hypothetical protein CM15mP102_18020 [Flavobacteriales bacterium]|nr:MAG: hypothetical protein CM15mP102_18020 [Flavobacteriales bacterium]